MAVAGDCIQRRSGRFRALILGAGAALLTVLATAGCGSASSAGQDPGKAIQRAAYVSSSAAGYKVAIHMQEGVSSLNGNITGVGTGSFNLPKHAGRMTLDLTLPGSLSSAGTLAVQEILFGGRIYVKLPAKIATGLPGHKPWLEIDLAQIGKAAGIQNLTSLFGGSGSTNPGQFLQYLRAASSGGVKRLAGATVDGVQTTEYRAKLDLLKAPAAAPSSQRAALRQAVSSLEKLTGLRTIPVDVWVDSQHLVRRITMAYSVNSSGQSVHTQMRLDFLSYGSQPVPAPPPSSQVTNASSMLSKTSG